jgi:hypothetical protein
VDRPGPDRTERDAAAAAALRRLETRLDRASEAAERLLAEAASRIGGTAGEGSGGAAGEGSGGAAGEGSGGAAGKGSGGAASEGSGGAAGKGSGGVAAAPAGPAAGSEQPPAAGWQVPGEAGPTPGRDLDLLIGVVQSLRDFIPDDLQRRLTEALRELLLAVRALIDWYLERVERRRSEPAEVQDIPIQ